MSTQAVETPRSQLAAGAVAAGLVVLAFSGWQYNFVLRWRHAGGSGFMSTSMLVMLWIVFAPVVIAIADRWPFTAGVRVRNGIRMTLVTVVFAACRAAIDHGIWLALSGQTSTPGEFFDTASLLFHSELLVTGALIVVANFLRLERESTHRAAVERRLQAALMQARVRKLRGDLDPHFLFNALNAVAAMIEIDHRAAQRIMTELTEMLRLSLATQDLPSIPLGSELEFIERYLSIQRVRFGDALSTSISVHDESLVHASIPPLLLQPLVENAVLHGTSKRRSGGRIIVAISAENGDLRMQVRDNGPGRAVDAARATGSVGIPNARERLRALFGSQHSFTFTRVDGEFIAEIRIPLQWKGSRA